VDGDPLTDIVVLDRVRAVYLRGQKVAEEGHLISTFHGRSPAEVSSTIP
jgi:hypothetical protein